MRDTTYPRGQNPSIIGFSHVLCDFSTTLVTDVTVNPDIKQYGELTMALFKTRTILHTMCFATSYM